MSRFPALAIAATLAAGLALSGCTSDAKPDPGALAASASAALAQASPAAGEASARAVDADAASAPGSGLSSDVQPERASPAASVAAMARAGNLDCLLYTSSEPT